MQHVRARHLAHVLAKVEHDVHHALAVHYPARAKSVAHALVDSVLQGNLDVADESFHHSGADAVDNVLRVAQALAAVRGRLYLDGQTVAVDVTLADLRYHIEVLLVDVDEGDLDVAEFRYGQDVREKAAGIGYAPRADEGDLEFGHGFILLF